MKIKHILVGLLALAAIGSAAGTVLAGYNTNDDVLVYSTSARGALQQARFSSDSKQYIGCGHSGNGYYWCYARNSSGTTKTCFSSGGDTNKWKVAGNVNRSSDVYFSIDGGDCKHIEIHNSSENL